MANEYDRRRAAVLEENVAKWGNPDIACVCGDAVRFAGMRGVFDVVSADVPCSGEGMMRKDADAAAQWSSAERTETAPRRARVPAKSDSTATKPRARAIFPGVPMLLRPRLRHLIRAPYALRCLHSRCG